MEIVKSGPLLETHPALQVLGFQVIPSRPDQIEDECIEEIGEVISEQYANKSPRQVRAREVDCIATQK